MSLLHQRGFGLSRVKLTYNPSMKKLILFVALPLIVIIFIVVTQYSRDIECYIKYWSHEDTVQVCKYFYKE